MYSFGKKSRSRLHGVHEDLIVVFATAIQHSDLDFSVIEGLRTLERQKRLLAQGASTTLKSRHLTGHAVDIAPYVDGQIRWDWPLYDRLAETIFEAADDCGITVEWGGDWKKFKDGPHWQLGWKDYPK